MKEKRIVWLDVAKFIAISIMVIGHFGLPSSLSNLIHIFHMPVFFIISGYCFNAQKHNKFLPFLVNRAKGLLVPYFFWGLVMYGIWYVVPRFREMGEFVSPLEFVKSILFFDARSPMFGGFGVIQWFFTALFISEMLLWVLVKCATKFSKYKAIIYLFGSLLLLSASVVCGYVFQRNWWGWISALLGTVMCLIGYLAKQYLSMFEHQYLLFAISFAMLVAVWCINGKTNMRTAEYGNIVFYCIGAVSGSYCIFAASNVISKVLSNTLLYRAIVYWGQNTAIILCFNRLVQWSVVWWFNKLLGYELGDTSVGYVKMIVIEVADWIIAMLCFIPIIWLVNRFLPFSVGRKSKNKQ